MSLASAINGVSGLSNGVSQDQVQGQASESDQNSATSFAQMMINQIVQQMTQPLLDSAANVQDDDDG